MTPEEKITVLQTMTDETNQTILNTYLKLAEKIVFENAYPFTNEYPETVPVQYDGVQIEIAAYMINKRGGEGELSHNENGISRHWENGTIPRSLLQRITPMSKPM